MIIGVTGGIGSGKSYVTNLLANQLNVPKLSADEIVAEITGPGGSGIEKIREVFGDDFITESGALNKLKMRELIFTDSDAKKSLERITTPLINKELRQAIEKVKSDFGLSVVEIPLLYESKYWIEDCDYIINVSCDRKTQIKRVKARNNFSEDLINQIIDSQATPEQRESIANFTIKNNEGDDLDSQLINIKDVVLGKITKSNSIKL